MYDKSPIGLRMRNAIDDYDMASVGSHFACTFTDAHIFVHIFCTISILPPLFFHIWSASWKI